MIEDELFPCLWHTFKRTRLSSTHTNTHTHSHLSCSCVNTLGSALLPNPPPQHSKRCNPTSRTVFEARMRFCWHRPNTNTGGRDSIFTSAAHSENHPHPRAGCGPRDLCVRSETGAWPRGLASSCACHGHLACWVLFPHSCIISHSTNAF